MASSPNRSRSSSSTSSRSPAPGPASNRSAWGACPTSSKIVGADADQAERAPVGLAGEQRLGHVEHPVRRSRGRVQAPGAGHRAKARCLQFQGDATGGETGLPETPRQRLGELPQDWAQSFGIRDVLVEGDFRGHAPGRAVRIDRAVVFPPGARPQPPPDPCRTGRQAHLPRCRPIPRSA